MNGRPVDVDVGRADVAQGQLELGLVQKHGSCCRNISKHRDFPPQKRPCSKWRDLPSTSKNFPKNNSVLNTYAKPFLILDVFDPKNVGRRVKMPCSAVRFCRVALVSWRSPTAQSTEVFDATLGPAPWEMETSGDGVV